MATTFADLLERNKCVHPPSPLSLSLPLSLFRVRSFSATNSCVKQDNLRNPCPPPLHRGLWSERHNPRSQNPHRSVFHIIPGNHTSLRSSTDTVTTVTCCDPRCIPEKFFDLKESEVVVVRNAGGNIRHTLRDIHILDTLFSLDELAIIHHTDCGTLHFSEEQIRSAAKGWSDEKYHDEIDKTVYGANAE